MRRKDREMPYEFALEIIDEASWGVLSLARDNEPYGLPLSIVREGNRLVFHTAREGHKYDFIQDGVKARVVFVSRVKVPDLYSNAKLDEMKESPEIIGKLISQVFTTEFASAMVGGTIREITEDAGKERVLELICRKYTPHRMDYFKLAVQSGMPMIRAFEISMDEVTAKRKKFDENRTEMKFGRME